MAVPISLNRGMRLQEITESSDLNVRVRDGRVRVTYRNKGLDIYDAKQREEMLEDNGITAVENAFMDGRERALSKKDPDVWK